MPSLWHIHGNFPFVKDSDQAAGEFVGLRVQKLWKAFASQTPSVPSPAGRGGAVSIIVYYLVIIFIILQINICTIKKIKYY